MLAWVEKGTEIIRLITADQQHVDLATHRVAQKIGQVQSRMLRMSSVFQRTLNQMERQKVHLGASGLSSADINRWLRGKSTDQLAHMLSGSARIAQKKGFVLGDICLDVAEYELVERVRSAEEESTLPPQHSAPLVQDISDQPDDYRHLEDLQQRLDLIAAEAFLTDVIPLETFEQACYRLSMVSLLGDENPARLAGPIGEFIRNGLRLQISAQPVTLDQHGIKDMSDGRLLRTRAVKEEKGGD